MKNPPRRISLLALAVMLLAACGGAPGGNGNTASQPAAGGDDFPVTIEAANGTVEISARPQRIVSLSPTATEMLFAIGAGDQVVAVDDQSNYPSEAPMTKLSGFEPNIEAIAKYEPDLVVASDTAALQRPLKSLKIPLLVQPAAVTLDDSYAQMEQLGVATGNIADAADEVASIQAEIDELVTSVPDFDEPPTYYHELDDTYFSVTSETFIGHVYSLVGLRNIADKADKAGSGYPQLSAEYIIDADPDLIFLADTKCCNQSLDTVAARPGWEQISAVQNEAVIELDDDVASRWGPRVVEYLRIVVDAVKDLELSKT